uniref:Uncharacterized protein n=1 Tax=Candidatus Kentrum sp. TC TaxID=2126339 RepID=A0A450ZL38_9GAMM|nr:MAG: hypothetical protein BECKTC1821F_GA0114240_100515 [Candidatus Kentron sp. TC]
MEEAVAVVEEVVLGDFLAEVGGPEVGKALVGDGVSAVFFGLVVEVAGEALTVF